jgi:hypothetical protein
VRRNECGAILRSLGDYVLFKSAFALAVVAMCILGKYL